MGFGNDFLNERMNYIDELFSADPNKLDRIEDLLKSANLQYEIMEDLYRELKGIIDEERADELLEYLYNNQVDPITAGRNYGQSDIKNKLRKEL